MSDTVLLEHGTELSRLKPRNIIQAARADIKLADDKRARGKWADQEKPYSFARYHVRRARGSVVVLLAIAYCEDAPATDKRSTLIVYSDKGLLREALAHLLAEESNQ